MVTCNLIGRLGNQMFQIAACAAHAWRTGQDFRIPYHSLDVSIWPTYFEFEKHTGKYIAPNFYEEPSHAYTPIPETLHDVKLHGYFQSEKYFKDYRQQIIDLFKIPYTEQLACCAVHIRLGDYLQELDKHPVVSIKYIIDAMEYVHEKTKCLKYVFFSDEVYAAQRMFPLSLLPSGLDFTFFSSGHPKNDLQIMSECAHQICANSSYSWWAAWLNQNQEKVVVMPKIWYGPGNAHLETKDIYQENAIVL